MATNHFMSCPSPENTVCICLVKYVCGTMVKVWSGLYFNIFEYIIHHYKFMTPFIVRAKK